MSSSRRGAKNGAVRKSGQAPILLLKRRATFFQNIRLTSNALGEQNASQHLVSTIPGRLVGRVSSRPCALPRASNQLLDPMNRLSGRLRVPLNRRPTPSATANELQWS